MSYIPTEELQEQKGHTMAPMIDFLFLMLALFASLALARIVMKDTEIELVRSQANPSSIAQSDFKIVNLSINQEGHYKWVTQIRDYAMNSTEEITQELLRQHESGLLPEEKLKTQVLLNIDKNARWDAILHVLLAIKEAGFQVRPVYES